MKRAMKQSQQNFFRFTSVGILLIAVFSSLISSAQGALDSWTDLGNILPGPSGASVLVTSKNGEIYGGDANGMTLFRYNLAVEPHISNIAIPGVGTQAARLAVAPNGKVYVAASKAYGKGNLAVYDPISGQIADIGSIDTEYAQGMTIGLDGKVYVATCCHGDIAVYDPADSNSPWYYMKYPVYNQVRLSGLAVGSDGMIYGVTSRIWISPYGDASLFRLNPTTRAVILIGSIFTGAHESWTIENNPYDGRLYMTVGYGMIPRLYAYDPALPDQGIQLIGQALGGDAVGQGGLAIAPDGKVYMLTSPDNRFYVFDPAQSQNGLVDLGTGTGGSGPLVFGSDHMLYGMAGTHLVRSNQVTPPTSYVIAGKVIDMGMQPVPDVSIQLLPGGSTTTTRADGSYAFYGLAAHGSYTIIPAKAAWSFTPAKKVVEKLSDNQTDINWTALPYNAPADPFLALPFLDLRSSQDFYRVMKDTDDKGILSSWFDHEYPDYTTANTGLILWNGRPFKNALTASIGCYDRRCYNGHNGYDLVAADPKNIPSPAIYPAAAGVVVEVANACTSQCQYPGCKACGIYGNYVVLAHDRGNGIRYYTKYGHLASINPEVKDEVSLSTTSFLGQMGTTGNSTGNHLHFSVFRDDGDGVWEPDQEKVVDPFGWAGEGGDPWVTSAAKAGPVSPRLWLFDPRVTGTQTGQDPLIIQHPGGVLATISPNLYTSGAIYELGLVPVPPLSGDYRSTGVSFQLRATEGTPQNIPGALQLMDTPAIQLVANLPPGSLDHLDTSKVSLAKWNETQESWDTLPSVYDADQATVSAQASDTGMFTVLAPLVCPADANEPNDSAATSKALLVGDPPAEFLFDIAGDEDWFAVQAVAGKEYITRVMPVGQGVDLTYTVFEKDGITQVQVDPIQHTWSATSDDVYYVRVQAGKSSTIGCQASYTATVIETKKVYLPAVVR